MKYRTIGRTDIEVSEIGFGVWTLTAGWWGDYTDEQAIEMLRRAYDLGITFFDTADTYGNGRGETVLAKAIKGVRDRVVIGTKFGYDIYQPHDQARRGHRELPHDFSPKFMRFALEQSLKRLETDYVDFYQLHNPRLPVFESDDIFEALERLREEGKIRHWGAALGPAIGNTEHGDGAMALRPEMAGLQIIYNMLEQEPARRFFEPARERGVGLIVRVPHSSGLLEGKYTVDTTFPPNDHRNHRPRQWLIDGVQKVDQLRFLSEGQNRTLGQVALKFVLADPVVSSALPNIYDLDQLEEFAAASDTPDLTAEELAKIEHLYRNNFFLEPASAAS